MWVVLGMCLAAPVAVAEPARLELFPERPPPRLEPPPAGEGAPPPGDRAPHGELEPAPRVPTAAYAYERPAGGDPELAQRLDGLLLAAISTDRRLSALDVHEVLDPVEPSLRAVDQARADLEQARRLIGTQRLPEAERLLAACAATFTRELGHAGPPDSIAESLREALALRAAVHFMKGELDQARATLQAVYNFNQRLRWVSRLYPESMKPFIEQSREQFAARRPGTLVLDSTPGGAQVLVSGFKLGQGRTTLEKLPEGPLYVTWVRRNRRALTSQVVVQGGQTTTLSPPLPHLASDDPLKRLEAAEAQVGNAEMPLLLIEAANYLRADLLVLLRYQPGDKGLLQLTAYLYDRRTRGLLKQARQGAPLDGLQVAVPRLVADLLDGARLDGGPALLARAAPAPPPQQQPSGIERLVRTRWFLPVLGSLVGAAVIGGVVGFVVAGR